MSTRALYTFKGAAEGEYDWNVYKHSDGYPTGAAETLATAQAWFAWKAPRYESDEFAAAFIAAGKAWCLVDASGLQDKERWEKYAPGGEYNSMAGGGVRLMPQGDPMQVAQKECGDIEYRYEIEQRPKLKAKRERLVTEVGKELWIKAFSGNWWPAEDRPVAEACIIECRLVDFPTMAASHQKALERKFAKRKPMRKTV